MYKPLTLLLLLSMCGTMTMNDCTTYTTDHSPPCCHVEAGHWKVHRPLAAPSTTRRTCHTQGCTLQRHPTGQLVCWCHVWTTHETVAGACVDVYFDVSSCVCALRATAMPCVEQSMFCTAHVGFVGQQHKQSTALQSQTFMCFVASLCRHHHNRKTMPTGSPCTTKWALTPR